ncbi:MAG: hypothetical protein EOO41_02375 [Methanobacteriota archaeon]|nr:MAG: hypothetical protein EOO41_02375 [Euryarchaeota archaeon]
MRHDCSRGSAPQTLRRRGARVRAAMREGGSQRWVHARARTALRRPRSPTHATSVSIQLPAAGRVQRRGPVKQRTSGGRSALERGMPGKRSVVMTACAAQSQYDGALAGYSVGQCALQPHCVSPTRDAT